MGKALNAKPANGITIIPDDMGHGYIKGYILNPGLRLVVRQYELVRDFVLDRGLKDEEGNSVMIAFHNVYHAKTELKSQQDKPELRGKMLPSVQVSTAGFNYEFFPANKKINSIVITVCREYLKELLYIKVENNLLKLLTSGTQPFLFEELISPQLQDVAIEIVTANPAKELENLYYKIKSEELIYLLFVELLSRQDSTLRSLNIGDVRKIYAVKDAILVNIDIPPKLHELVKISGMSESKLKRIFKQVFGCSVYNYYQNFRMKEAAYLIKDEKLSVSEAGYRLGFSNLSHFARLFEMHIGMKPKKYSKS